MEAEIIGFLEALGDLFRGAITFSCILPQVNQSCIDAIGRINSAVIAACIAHGFGWLRCPAFERRNGLVDASLFAKSDGIHLGPPGIKAIFNTLEAHLINENNF